uniref:Uncharacterized protein n=2 Tax=Micrurus TaxID=8634 RepID=A0A2D4GAC2_MICCO
MDLPAGLWLQVYGHLSAVKYNPEMSSLVSQQLLILELDQQILERVGCHSINAWVCMLAKLHRRCVSASAFPVVPLSFIPKLHVWKTAVCRKTGLRCSTVEVGLGSPMFYKSFQP